MNPAADSIRHWKTKLETNLGFSQTSLTNWAAGGENTLAANALLNIFADYSRKKFTWNNYLGAGYGLIKQQSLGDKWRKADDKVGFFSKAGIYAWKNWDYTTLLDFKTQFANGYKDRNDSVYLSQFFSPAYLQTSVGLNYKPATYFSLFMSPIGARFTFVMDQRLSDEGAYGVNPGEHLLYQAGASLNAIFKKDLAKNVNLLSKVDMFSNYIKNPGNIIINWENLLQVKVMKYISLAVATTLIKDKNVPVLDSVGVEHFTQFKETFTVGFAYSFSH